MTVLERVAYVQGMISGLGLDQESSKEAKILIEMLGVLKQVGEELDSLSETVSDLECATYFGDDMFDDDDDDDDDEDDDEEDGCCCGRHHGHHHHHHNLFQAECPNCGEQLVVNQSVLEAGSIDCPTCGSKFAVSLEDDEDDEEDSE